jgi:hypothetical protein
MRPKDIAPKIFEIARKRKCTVKKAIDNEFWVSQLNIQGGISMEHIMHFYNLWEMLQNVHIDQGREDMIIWKLGKDGSYSASSAYKMQFLGLTTSFLPALIWKPWAPPKCKMFAWLVIQNRVWTADRLHRRDW